MTSQSSASGATDRQSGAVAATTVGLVLQVLMVAVGHAVPAWRPMWGPVGTLISLVVGIWAGWNAARGASAATWGAVAGGLGALVGIGIAVGLGDVPSTLLALGTGASILAGIVGALVTWFARRR